MQHLLVQRASSVGIMSDCLAKSRALVSALGVVSRDVRLGKTSQVMESSPKYYR